MTGNKTLREMLDERGVEWEDMSARLPTGMLWCTEWTSQDGEPCTAIEGADDIPDGKLSVQALLTPAQAIELTLGRGTCVPILNSERDCRPYLSLWFVCSECGCRLTENRLGKVWQKFCPNCGRRIVEVDE